MTRKQVAATLAILIVAKMGAIASPETAIIGVDLLRVTDPTLLGTDVRVAQVEAPFFSDSAWQVNPTAVGQPVSLLTYYSSGGTSSTFPNSLGSESGHADNVAVNFYGNTGGVAPGVAHVDNYEANHFYQSVIVVGLAIPAKIVNQSFIFGSSPPQATLDTQYDNYAVQNNTLFVSGVGNSGPPSAPATSYNGIGVGVSDAGSSVGPTLDNGRSKPDITAPGGATSFSTPFVAGAAAILVHAGTRGDGGAGTTSSSTDLRTVKALLLNGAVKPSGWTHTATAPLDTRFGVGVLNVFNSYKQLAAERTSFVESTGVTVGGAHPPGSNPGNLSWVGWDFNTIASTVTQDKVNHYYFNLPANGANRFTLTATLVWNRPVPPSSFKNLDLFLYDMSTGNAVASSVSTVDNVEHIYFTNLVAGRYDLQIFKEGGVGNMGTETYAVAFESFAAALSIAKLGSDGVITWPLFPAGFRLESTPDLNPPVAWTTAAFPVSITNNQNRVTAPATAAAQFFRLVRP